MSTQPSESLNPAPAEPSATTEPCAVASGRTGKSFEELFAQLSETARTRPEGSHTVQRLDAGVHAIGKKIVEEAAEVWMAAEHEGNDAAALEISQLLYHLQVMMISLGLSLEDVYAKL